jgi:hypothetical protein
LASALRGGNAVACVHYVVSACRCFLVGFTLVSRDCFSNLCNLGCHIRFGVLNIIDFFIASFGNIGQSTAKCHHSIKILLKSKLVGLVLADDIESLVCTLAKGVPDGVGCFTLLLSESGVGGFLQRSVEIVVLHCDRLPVHARIVKNLQCRSAYPLETNQKCRPLTRRIIGSHLQIP